MKKGLAIGLAATAVAAAVSSLVSVGVSAGPLTREPDARAAATRAPHMLSADRIAEKVRAMGLDPRDAPLLRGRYYVLHATDPRGAELRVLADAEDGDILSVLPARASGAHRPAPHEGAGPRIIHVPQPHDLAAEGDDRDGGVQDVGAPDADNGYEPPPQSEVRPPVRKIYPAPHPRSELPRLMRHIVSSAPPPPPQAGANHKDKALTPVYPMPAFRSNAGATKFDRLPPQDSEAAPPRRLE